MANGTKIAELEGVSPEVLCETTEPAPAPELPPSTMPRKLRARPPVERVSRSIGTCVPAHAREIGIGGRRMTSALRQSLAARGLIPGEGTRAQRGRKGFGL